MSIVYASFLSLQHLPSCLFFFFCAQHVLVSISTNDNFKHQCIAFFLYIMLCDSGFKGNFSG